MCNKKKKEKELYKDAMIFNFISNISNMILHIEYIISLY